MRKSRKRHGDNLISTRDSDILIRNYSGVRGGVPLHGRGITDAQYSPNLSLPLVEASFRIGVDITPTSDGIYVMVWDKKLRKELEEFGIFPRNVGMGHRKSRDFHNTEDASAISLYDLLYAYQLGIVDSNHNNRAATYDHLLTLGTINDIDFLEKYAVYIDLRSKGTIVMDGLNYGVDFVIYSDDPDQFKSAQRGHSTALIDVGNGKNIRLTEIIKGEQLAKSINKFYFVATAKGMRDDMQIQKDIDKLKKQLYGRGSGALSMDERRTLLGELGGLETKIKSAEGHLLETTGEVSYHMANTRELGIDSTVDINAQIAKRLGSDNVVAWELRKKY